MLNLAEDNPTADLILNVNFMQYALLKRQLMYKMLEARHMRQIIKTSRIYRFMPLQTM